MNERRLVEGIVRMGYFVAAQEERIRDLCNLADVRVDFAYVLSKGIYGAEIYALWRETQKRYAELAPEDAFRIFNAHNDREAIKMMSQHVGVDAVMRKNCEMTLSGSSKVQGHQFDVRVRMVRGPLLEDLNSEGRNDNIVKALEE